MPKDRGQPIVISELDEVAGLRHVLGLHPGLVYIKSPGLGPGVRQWVVADRDACDSAALLVWRRHVTVISAGPSRILVAGRTRGRSTAVIEVWENKVKLSDDSYRSQEELAAAMSERYDDIGADLEPDDDRGADLELGRTPTNPPLDMPAPA